MSALLILPLSAASTYQLCPSRLNWPLNHAEKKLPRPWNIHLAHKSGNGQDAWIDTAVFQGATNGTYLDIGCNDGLHGSNSLFFRRARGWRGVCVEADPSMKDKIEATSGRTDAINAAVSRSDGTATFEVPVTESKDGGLSGLSSTIDHERTKRFATSTRTVTTISPKTLLTTYYHDRPTIDVVNLDVEGHELPVLRAWQPSLQHAYCVHVWIIENNDHCKPNKTILPDLEKLLGPRYTKVIEIGHDEIFVRKTPCPRRKRAQPVPQLRLPPYPDPGTMAPTPVDEAKAAALGAEALADGTARAQRKWRTLPLRVTSTLWQQSADHL